MSHASKEKLNQRSSLYCPTAELGVSKVGKVIFGAASIRQRSRSKLIETGSLGDSGASIHSCLVLPSDCVAQMRSICGGYAGA